MTPRLHLTDTRDGAPLVFGRGPVRVRRSGSVEVVARGPETEVVSGLSACFGRREATGLGFALPVKLVRSLRPPDLCTELPR